MTTCGKILVLSSRRLPSPAAPTSVGGLVFSVFLLWKPVIRRRRVRLRLGSCEQVFGRLAQITQSRGARPFQQRFFLRGGFTSRRRNYFIGNHSFLRLLARPR